VEGREQLHVRLLEESFFEVFVEQEMQAADSFHMTADLEMTARTSTG
jgi:hypothetical protein